jgi:hypothetical protein
MTDLASELDQKLTQLAPTKARALERLVREAMALADANDPSRATTPTEAGIQAALNLRVYPLSLPSPDFERLRGALDESPHDLPRLRELLSQPGRLGHA